MKLGVLSIRKKLKKLPVIYRLYNLRNGFWKKGLIVSEGNNVLLKGIRVSNHGEGNGLHVGEKSIIKNCKICISGSNNIIYIGADCSLCGTNFYIEGDNNKICISDKTTTTNNVDLCAIEGTELFIGKDCMLSSQIYISTGDGHSVCDAKCSRRTNASKDIKIGNHVWIGTQVIVGKGVHIGDNSIVAAGSVCTSSIENYENVIVGGNPACVVRRDVNWLRERIKA